MLAGSNLRAMRSRRLLAVSTLAATAIAWATVDSTVSAGDGDDDLDKNVLIAEAQFQLFLVESDFVPSDITCTRPPIRNSAGELLCYALISDRVSVAAVATMESPGMYSFLPLNKVDPDDLERDVPVADPPVDEPVVEEPPPTSDPDDIGGDVDEAVLASIDSAVADSQGLSQVLIDNNASIASLDRLDYHAPTSTVQVQVTSNATDAAARDTIAFYVTDVMAYLWMENEPTRDADATIHPRLEVTVDDVLYGTPFDVMVDVADYTITEGEWLEIVTGNAAFQAASRVVPKLVADRPSNPAGTTAGKMAVKVAEKTPGKPARTPVFTVVDSPTTHLLAAIHGAS